MIHDLHLHTVVSDGELDPVALLRLAHAYGVSRLSITDHDALGAYTWRGGAVFDQARQLGLDLVVGLELDALMDGVEVHLLGFAVDLQARRLDVHLREVQAARSERARREIEIVNSHFGPDTIREADVFVDGRQTLMKPHFIHPLLERGVFPSYGQANAWYKQNVSSGVEVPKPSLAAAIELVHDAGGSAVLAHPGYYQALVEPIDERLAALKSLGLDGVEVDYPYHACSPRRFSSADERLLIGRLRRAALQLDLERTRGSDCHTRADFEKVYGASAAGATGSRPTMAAGSSKR
jgi:predicted metal-dependent phosphoesterase TrpH